ncbi:MAG: tryptophan--tRNA ligase [Planctomycetota bacterium]|jgi:tryptophanyl-tRNA synthetase
MSKKERPVLLSGQQPSGNLMIGNLIGALRNWVTLQETHDTTRQEPKDVRKRTLDLLCLYIAAGIDPEKNTVFVQSHVPAHSELAWILGCHTYMGELGRMTQFKDKSKKAGTNIATGLFTYPTLMAADILLYDADLVPVGDDQRQHLEITRDIAQRWNNLYGETFTVPEAYIPPVGSRIMSLIDPTAKMSKSDENPKSYVALLDPPEVVRSKIKKAVTDSGTEIRYAPEERPAISNLMTIRSVLAGEAMKDIEAAYGGKGYGVFKDDLAEVVIETLRPIQERFAELRSDKKEVERIMAEGAAAAERRGRRILDKVKRKVGFVPRPRKP